MLEVSDAIEAYLAAWRRIDAVQGRAFNLGGGPANAVSLRQVIAAVEDETGRTVETAYSDWRAGDQRYYVSDTRSAARDLGLRPPVPWRRGLAGAGALAARRARPETAGCCANSSDEPNRGGSVVKQSAERARSLARFVGFSDIQGGRPLALNVLGAACRRG